METMLDESKKSTPVTTKITGSEALIRCLLAEGVDVLLQFLALLHKLGRFQREDATPLRLPEEQAELSQVPRGEWSYCIHQRL